MTSPTSSTPSYAPSPAAFAICSGIVSAALATFVSFIAVRMCGGTDADINTLAAVAFVLAVVGGFVGMALGVRVRERKEALAASLAPAIYVMTVLAIPF